MSRPPGLGSSIRRSRPRSTRPRPTGRAEATNKLAELTSKRWRARSPRSRWRGRVADKGREAAAKKAVAERRPGQCTAAGGARGLQEIGRRLRRGDHRPQTDIGRHDQCRQANGTAGDVEIRGLHKVRI